jgi:predicted enzyme related to lactoylglutathione lyase
MGNSFVHIELNTDDVAKAKKFYKSVFDWKITDMPQMGYAMVDVGKGTGGGMQKKPMAEQRNAWLPYVDVADVKKSLAKAAKAGAHVVVDAMSIGDDMGEIGVFIDPTGAAIGVWAAAKKTAKKKTAKKKTAKKKKR